jgi:peptidyl-prolyl cis-trans isomerase C
MKHALIRTVSEKGEAAFSGCGMGRTPSARRAPDAPPVFVNGVEIPETAIAREAQNHVAATADEARAAAARALAIRELLLQRARAIGLAADPRSDNAGRCETDEEALVRGVLETEAAPAEPTEQECRRFFSAASHRFQAPELYEASHILIAVEGANEAVWAEGRARAAELITALRENGARFAELARAHSACPTAEHGGALGQLQHGDLAKEIETALLDLDEGCVCGEPVATRHGWHVLRLDRRVTAAILPYEAVAERIRNALRERASIAAAARYVETLARGARIEGIDLSTGRGTPV